MKKLILAFFAALCCTVMAYAENFTVDGIEYSVTSGNTVTIVSNSSLSGCVEIPATVNYGNTTYNVTSIGESAFGGCESLTSVTIPASVTSIGTGAFSLCQNLATVSFANNSQLETMGDYAFFNCTSLTSVTIPASVTSIGTGTFSNCTSLTSVTIPASVTSIGQCAFQYCENLATISFANNSRLETMGDYAFYNCTSLTSVTIPASVTSIGQFAFQDCENLASVSFANNSQLKTMGDYAFSNCTSLASVTIPASVTSIGTGAFSFCENLASVSFANNSQLKTMGNNAFSNCTSLTSVTIPASVTSIGTWAFSLCEKLASVSFANNSQLETMGDYAFYNCTSLTSVTIPASVTSIGTRAFFSCVNMASVSFADNSQLKTMGDYAFSNCTSLASVTIPASVTSIGNQAFSFCENLASVSFANNSQLKTMGVHAFSNCTSLASVTIPASVTSIGTWAFSLCEKLASVSFVNNSQLETMGDYAFYNCTSLTSVTIPASVTSIGNQAFYNCSGLTSLVVLATTPPTLVYNTFYDVPKDIPVYVPDVETYNGWGGFTNFKGWADHKSIALAEINAAKEGVTMSTEDGTAVSQYITLIENAENLADIYDAKTAALAIIFQARKYNAIAAIEDAMKEIATFTDKEKSSINDCKTAINAATTKEEIDINKNAALVIIDLRKFKDNAIAELNDYIKDMVGVDITGYVSNIENAESTDVINEILNTAKSLINSMSFATIGTKKYKLEYNQDTYTLERDITINDKDTYQSDHDFTATGNISYCRDVSPVIGKWQAWFVPFDMTLKGDDLDKFDAAQVAGVLTDNDGQPVIAFKKMKEGEKMKANIPYVIRPKSGIVQEISLHLLMPEFHSSATTPFVIQSAYDNFTLGGIYEAQQNSNWYALTKDGVFKKMNGAPAPTLQPQRIWMTVSPREDDPYATKSVSTTRNNGTKSTVIPDVIRIVVLGDDGSPEGKPVREAKIINADGQSVNRIQRGQIYRISGNVNE